MPKLRWDASAAALSEKKGHSLGKWEIHVGKWSAEKGSAEKRIGLEGMELLLGC